MHSTLRPVALHVEEPEPGAYLWVLIERKKGETWQELDRSGEPVETFKQAMADGLVALEALVDDLDIGPRQAAGALKDSPAGKSLRHARDAEAGADADEPPKTPARSLFGFGPAR